MIKNNGSQVWLFLQKNRKLVGSDYVPKNRINSENWKLVCEHLNNLTKQHTVSSCDWNFTNLSVEWVLRWGWVFLERTRILSGIHFTTYFIEIFVVETKRFVSSFLNVILTQQSCGQHSSRAGKSKRQAIGYYFSERICYMSLISKCRGDWDLGLCTTSVPAFEEPQRDGKIRGKNVFWRR